MLGTLTGYSVYRDSGDDRRRYTNVDGRGAPAIGIEEAIVRALETLVDYPHLDYVVLLREIDGIPDWSSPLAIDATAVFAGDFLAWREEHAGILAELGQESERRRAPLAARRYAPAGVHHYSEGFESIPRPERRRDDGLDAVIDEYSV